MRWAARGGLCSGFGSVRAESTKILQYDNTGKTKCRSAEGWERAWDSMKSVCRTCSCHASSYIRMYSCLASERRGKAGSMQYWNTWKWCVSSARKKGQTWQMFCYERTDTGVSPCRWTNPVSVASRLLFLSYKLSGKIFQCFTSADKPGSSISSNQHFSCTRALVVA